MKFIILLGILSVAVQARPGPQAPLPVYGGPGEILKSVYFFDSPFAETRIPGPRVYFTGKSNRRVIFIKTPTYTVDAPVLPPAGTLEGDKTRIVVISEPPKQGEPIDISKLIPTGGKPEVVYVHVTPTTEGPYQDNVPVKPFNAF